MTKQPLLLCTICFILGILGQDFFQLNSKSWGVILGISTLFLGLGLVKKRIFDKLKSVFLLHFFVVVGSFCHFLNLQKPKLPQLSDNKLQNITFQLTKKLNSNEKNKRYKIEILNLEKPFSAVISIPKEQKELDYQHYYSAEAYLNLVQKPQHSYQFDYQKYLARQNIYFQGYIPNEIIAQEKENISFLDLIKQKRLDLLHKIENSALKPQNKALLKGIILADRTEMDRSVIQDFTQTGLIHILAISGSHMAIIFMMILLVLKPIFPVKWRNFPIYISLFCIWIFAIFIDFGSSVVRSCLMISIYYFYVFLQRMPNILHSIALSALMILIMDTHQIFDVGFQLSFFAVLGIFGFYQPVKRLFGKPKNQAVRWLVNTLAITFSAQVAVLPLVIFYFHQFSPMSVLINVPSILIAEIFIIFSFVMCILFGINLMLDGLLKIYDIFATFFLDMVHFFADMDFSFTENIPFSWAEMMILFGIVYVFRKILLDFSVKNGVSLLTLIFLFFSVRIGLNVYFWQKEEVLSHQFFKQNIVSIKNGNHATFFVSENNDIQKVRQYIIAPYSTAMRIDSIETKTTPPHTSLKINGKTYEIR